MTAGLKELSLHSLGLVERFNISELKKNLYMKI